jgi:hypothetical protein
VCMKAPHMHKVLLYRGSLTLYAGSCPDSKALHPQCSGQNSLLSGHYLTHSIVAEVLKIGLQKNQRGSEPVVLR